MLILLRVQTCLQRRCGAEHLNPHLPEKTCIKSANHRFHSWEGSAKISQKHHDHWATLWHLSPSTWTLSKGTFFLFFFPPPNLSFLIIEKLVPANTAWENICEQDFLGRQRRITIKSWNVSLQSLKVISLSLGRHNQCFHHLFKENVIDSIKCQRSRSKEITTVIQSALKRTHPQNLLFWLFSSPRSLSISNRGGLGRWQHLFWAESRGTGFAETVCRQGYCLLFCCTVSHHMHLKEKK